MTTLKTLYNAYLSEHFWLADSTKDTTGRAFRYLAEAIGNITIERLEYRHFEQYKNFLLRTGRAKTTTNIYLRALAPVLSWAVNLKLLKENPIAGIKQLKITRKPIRIYEDWQFERMLRFAPDNRWRAILLCAKTAGLRRGAVLNLTRDNIRNGFIFVEPKRNTARTWEWEPKDREIRKIPLVPQLEEILQGLDCYYVMLSQRRYEANLRLKNAGILSGWIRRCPDQNFRRSFVAIQRKAFGRQVGDFHSLRKTYITLMCEELPEHFVAKLTGHTNSKTMTYYLASRESYFDIARQVASKGIKNRDAWLAAQSKGDVAAASRLGDTGLEPVTSCV